MPFRKPRIVCKNFNQSCKEHREEDSDIDNQRVYDESQGNRSTNLWDSTSLNNDHETVAIVSKLRDVEAVTVAVFESLLSFIFGLKSQPSSWSLVSKMIQSKRVACEEETKVNDFSKVDAGLHSGNEYNQLDNLESCIQDHEERLQFPFRQLIKTRVSLLNILNH
ncbi:hypothetical protein ACFX1X_003650 [Malus domestica]